MDEKDERQTDRRRLLRGAGAVVAGVAGAGVAGAVAATPASAATGDPVVAGQNNTANATTGIEVAGAAAPESTPALRVTNAGGPALAATPVASDLISGKWSAAPAGSIYVDDYADIYSVGEVDGKKHVHMAYSPTWATMTVPIKPTRWLDTRTTAGSAHVLSGSGTISGGKILPKGTNQADLVLDFREWLIPNYIAAQVIVSVHGASGDGWLTLWGDGNWPEAVTVNFLGGHVIGGFAQCLLSGQDPEIPEPFGLMKIKVTHSVALTVDVVGFIAPDPYALFKPGTGPAIAAAPNVNAAPRRR